MAIDHSPQEDVYARMIAAIDRELADYAPVVEHVKQLEAERARLESLSQQRASVRARIAAMLGGQAAPSPPAAPAPAAAAAVLLAPTVAPPVPVQLHVGDLGPATPPSAERGRRIRRNERDGRTKGTISFREAVLRQLKAAWPNDVEDAVLGRNAVAMGAVTDMADVARAADNVCRAFQRRLKLPVVRTTARHWKWDGGREGLPL